MRLLIVVLSLLLSWYSKAPLVFASWTGKDWLK